MGTVIKNLGKVPEILINFKIIKCIMLRSVQLRLDNTFLARVLIDEVFRTFSAIYTSSRK